MASLHRSYYFRYTDFLERAAINTTGSAEDEEYPASNIDSEDPSEVAKLTTTTGNFVYEFGSKVVPVAVALFNQYLDEGLTGVKLQGNDTDSWGAPSFEFDIEDIPAKRFDGYGDNPWTDNILREIGDLPDPTGYLFWRLLFEDANSQVIEIGRWSLLSAMRPIDVFRVGDIEEGEEADVLNQRTERKVLIATELGGPMRTFSAAIIGTDLAAGSSPVQEAADFRRLQQGSNSGVH